MTKFKQLKRAYRYGSCLQSSTVPSIYEPSSGRARPDDRAAFVEAAKRLTTFSMGLGVANVRRLAALVDAKNGRQNAVTVSVGVPAEREGADAVV